MEFYAKLDLSTTTFRQLVVFHDCHLTLFRGSGAIYALNIKPLPILHGIAFLEISK